MQRDVDILIKGNRIIEISDRDNNRTADRVIDASDAYVCPGLIDIHAHQGSWAGATLGKQWLAWGVTSTRDPATNPYDALNRKEATMAGHYNGPRIFFTGSPIDGNRVYYAGTYAQQSEQQLMLELGR
ncbi:MAG: amidohydrolase, partial [Bacteroidota bacterium]